MRRLSTCLEEFCVRLDLGLFFTQGRILECLRPSVFNGKVGVLARALELVTILISKAANCNVVYLGMNSVKAILAI